MRIDIRFPNEKDITWLAKHLRTQDQQEVIASHGEDFHQIIRQSIEQSSDAWALLVDGKLMFIAGIGEVSLISGVASPWLLGTDLVTKYPKVFLSYTRQLIREVLKTHEVLFNFVDVRNTLAIRYLKHMGFVFHEAQPYGRLNQLFYPFEMVA